ARVLHLDGAVETSIQLGVADAIADVVETGSTLKQAGLVIVGDVIMESEAVLITRAGAEPEGLTTFRRRLEGVLVARSYLMMDYDIPSERVEDAIKLTPGLESPTVSPLHREGWVAVRSMVPSDGAQQLMDDLYEIGARAILLTDIHACRL
ncbi:MAG: ATP phosphoribosyltransferase, partial [Marmoricola sp.]